MPFPMTTFLELEQLLNRRAASGIECVPWSLPAISCAGGSRTYFFQVSGRLNIGKDHHIWVNSAQGCLNIYSMKELGHSGPQTVSRSVFSQACISDTAKLLRTAEYPLPTLQSPQLVEYKGLETTHGGKAGSKGADISKASV